MTVNPTDYDLLQDQMILPIRDILLNAAEPPTGDEFSYPIPDQALSSEMWRWVTKGVGNGVIDRGDSPYTLVNNGTANNTNSTRSMILKVGTRGTANAIIEGFYHHLSNDKIIEFPMPSSGTVTYTLCLTYDPREEKAAQGPISIERFSGEPPTTFDRVHVVLYRVRCSASQLLTNATITRERPRIAPAIYVWAESHRPDPAQVLWGTICVVGQTASIYRSANADEAGGEGGARAWVNVTNPAWAEYGDTPTYRWPGHGYRRAIQRQGLTRRLRGRLERTSGQAFTQTPNGYLMMTLEPADRPPREVRFVTAGSNLLSPNIAVINISSGTGEVRAHPTSGMNWVSLDNISWDVE